MSSPITQWTFSRSTGFVQRRDFLFTYFERELDRVLALHSPQQSELLDRNINLFVALLSAIEDLESGKALPQKSLALVKEDVDAGFAIYSLVSTVWRCFYLVRPALAMCTAVQIDKLTTTERNVEYHRHTSGPMLSNHP